MPADLVAIAALVALLVGVKLALCLSLGDVFVTYEEVEKGAEAKAILDGLDVPYYLRAYHHHAGGSFAASHLTALAYMLVGQNLWAHKIVSISLNVLMLAAGYLLLARHFGRASAIVFGLLFVFAPRGIQHISLLDLGIHYEAALFLLSLFAATLALLDVDEPRPRDLFLWGAIAGASAFFDYQNAPAVAFAGAALALKHARCITRRRVASLAAGIALGFAPWIAAFASVGTSMFKVHGTWLFQLQPEQAGESSVFHDQLAAVRALFLDASLLERFVLGVRMGTPLLAVLWLVWPGVSPPRARRNAAFIAGYLALFTAIYLASSFAVPDFGDDWKFLRLVPFWILATLLSSVLVAQLFAHQGRMRPRAIGLAVVLGGTLLADGIFASVRIARAGQPDEPLANARRIAHAKAYTYAEYFAKIAPRLDLDDEEKLRAFAGFDEPDPELLYSGISTALFEHSDTPVAELLAMFERAAPGHERELALGLGPRLLRMYSRELVPAVAFAESLGPTWRDPLIEALGRRGLFWRPNEKRLAREIEKLGASLERESVSEPYFRGLGYRTFLADRLASAPPPELVAAVPARLRGAVLAGWEHARDLHTLR